MNFDMKVFGDKAKGLLKTASEKTRKASSEACKQTDRLAELVAAKVTEVTGRETTASEVKRATVVVAGAILVGTAATALANNRNNTLGMTANAGSGSAWGNDFESQVAQTFAENGYSLNYYTPHVDSEGTVYYEPNG